MTMQFTSPTPSRFSTHHAKAVASDRRTCRRLVALTLPVFLVLAAASRVVPGRAKPGPSGKKLSIYAQARANAYATIPFMFMG